MTDRLAEMETSLDRLGQRVAKVTGAADALPRRVSLPTVTGLDPAGHPHEGRPRHDRSVRLSTAGPRPVRPPSPERPDRIHRFEARAMASPLRLTVCAAGGRRAGRATGIEPGPLSRRSSRRPRPRCRGSDRRATSPASTRRPDPDGRSTCRGGSSARSWRRTARTASPPAGSTHVCFATSSGSAIQALRSVRIRSPTDADRPRHPVVRARPRRGRWPWPRRSTSAGSARG